MNNEPPIHQSTRSWDKHWNWIITPAKGSVRVRTFFSSLRIYSKCLLSLPKLIKYKIVSEKSQQRLTYMHVRYNRPQRMGHDLLSNLLSLDLFSSASRRFCCLINKITFIQSNTTSANCQSSELGIPFIFTINFME